MVIISGLTPLSTVAAAAPRRRLRQQGSGFDVPEDGDILPAVPTAPASALSGLLAMQESALAGKASLAETGDRAAQSHAEAVLRELGSLQIALLRGQPGAAASRLADLARAAPQAFDPGLAAVLCAVRLRAEVETARGAAVRPPVVRRQGDT